MWELGNYIGVEIDWGYFTTICEWKNFCKGVETGVGHAGKGYQGEGRQMFCIGLRD